jgi:FkbM family methyltransferase
MSNIQLTPFCYREINPKIIENKKYTENVTEDIYRTGQPLNKFWTFDFIETISDFIDFSEIKVIFDIGSRDGYQSVEFRHWFPEAKIFLFEPNPNTIESCIQNTKNLSIEVIEKAVGETNCRMDFFQCPSEPGCSSILEINPSHQRSKYWYQSKIKVDMIRLDYFCEQSFLENIDILWMDVQGYEKMVLEGCGELLKSVKTICTEVAIGEMYKNSTMKNELDDFLKMKDFIEIKTFHMGWQDDGRIITKLEEISETIGECDVIYINKKFIK